MPISQDLAEGRLAAASSLADAGVRPYCPFASVTHSTDTRLSPSIFISYSHVDIALVAPVVAVLRASRNFVYLDSDSIRPGKKWREELEAAIAKSDMVMLFWCEHSEASIEVGKEIVAAKERGKDLLPLLLDSTALPPTLAEYQYIDFRAAFGKAHSPSTVMTMSEGYVGESPMPASSSKRTKSAPLLSTILVMGAVFLLAWVANKYLPSPWHWTVQVAFALLAVLALGSLLRGGVRAPPLVLPPTPGRGTENEADVRAIAGRIEAELQRKLRPETG